MSKTFPTMGAGNAASMAAQSSSAAAHAAAMQAQQSYDQLLKDMFQGVNMGVLDPAEYAKMFNPLPLTPEEEAKLKELEHQHTAAMKTGRINLFKSMPSYAREMVISTWFISEMVNGALTYSVAKTAEHEQLEQKSINFKTMKFSSGLGFSPSHGWNPSNHTELRHDALAMFKNTLISMGSTITDLLEAHINQCMEESLLK